MSDTSWWVFSVQSLWDDDLYPTKIECPWQSEIEKKEILNVKNPLSEYSLPVLSVQRGVHSKTYDGRWGQDNQLSVWWERSAKRREASIDAVHAQLAWKNLLCIYSAWEREIFTLLKEVKGECDAVNGAVIGVKCR